MSYTKTIVCLANSRRPGGWCVAGKEVLDDGCFGEWIRPVNAQNYDDAISPENMELVGGGCPKLLDVISVPLVEHVPKPHQPENHQIDSGRSWIKQGILDKRKLPMLVDDAFDIWRIRRNAPNDRVWASCIHEVNRSLLLIRPESLTIDSSGWKIRANFRYNGATYNLSVTDPVAAARHAASSVYLCVSIAGQPWRGSYFKLVAAIIGDAD